MEETASPLSSKVGSIAPFANAFAERPTLGLARRTFPSDGFFGSGSTTWMEFSGMAPVSELALGMRSVIAAGCTLPGAGEENAAGPSIGALALLDVVTAGEF